MIYRGHVENGLVVLNDSVALPEGAEVTIEIREQPKSNAQAASVRAYFGIVSSGDLCSADNDRIDADLARIHGTIE